MNAKMRTLLSPCTSATPGILLVIILIGGSEGKCPDGWMTVPSLINGQLLMSFDAQTTKCVMLHLNRVNWHRAKAICIGQGAKLVEINSPQESQQLLAITSSKVKNKSVVPYWMGGNDLATHNRWAWASLGYRIYPFVNWDDGYPTTDNGRHCIGLDPNTFRWRNENCEDVTGYFFCEMHGFKENDTSTSSIATTKSSPLPDSTLKPANQISFNGDGFLELDKKLISYNANMKTDIKVEISTWQQEGLLLWQGVRRIGMGERGINERNDLKFYKDINDDPDMRKINYIALAIKGGKMNFVVNDKHLSHPNHIDDGKKHLIVIYKVGELVTLGVDIDHDNDASMVSATLPKIDPKSIQEMDIFLGGIPADGAISGDNAVHSYTGGKFDKGFSGCIHFFYVYNNFMDGKLEGSGKSFGGPVNFSDSHLKRKGYGVKVNSNRDVCEIPPLEPTKQTSTTTRKTSTASLTTLSFKNTTTASQKPSYSKYHLAFDGNAYIRLRRDLIDLDRLDYARPDSINSYTIRFKLETFEHEGLLFWFGKRERDVFGSAFSGIFMALGVKDGYMEFVWDFGGGVKTLDTSNAFTPKRVDDGRIHEIELILLNQYPIVDLDGLTFDGPAYGDSIFPVKNFYVGGLSGDIWELTGHLYNSNFHGCLHEMTIKQVDQFENIQTRKVSFSSDVIKWSPRNLLSQDFLSQCASVTKPPTDATKPAYIKVEKTSTVRQDENLTKSPTNATKPPYIKEEKTSTVRLDARVTKPSYIKEEKTSTVRQEASVTKPPYINEKKTSTVRQEASVTKPSYIKEKKTSTVRRQEITSTTKTTITTTTVDEDQLCMYENVRFEGIGGYVVLKNRLIGRFKGRKKHLSEVDNMLIITLEIATKDPNGLLLWQGSVVNDQHFISLAVKDGYVEFKVNTGSNLEAINLRSSARVADGAKWKIMATRREDGGELVVGRAGVPIDVVRFEQPQSRNLDVMSSDLYIGGSPTSVRKMTGGRYNQGFNGCITLFKIRKLDGGRAFGARIYFDQDKFVVLRRGVECIQSCTVS